LLLFGLCTKCCEDSDESQTTLINAFYYVAKSFEKLISGRTLPAKSPSSDFALQNYNIILEYANIFAFC